MAYELMHKNIPVAVFEIAESGHISDVTEVLNRDHLPIGAISNGTYSAAMLAQWWQGRSIPATRSGIKQFLSKIGMDSSIELLSKSMGLSLSDQYWFREQGSQVNWENVNFFQNPFTEDVGDMLFGKIHAGEMDLESPDNTSDGVLMKRWTICDGKRCLLKSGAVPNNQEPINEVIASAIMKRVGIEHVEYRFTEEDNRLLSVCEDFVNENTEFVPATHVINLNRRQKNHSLYQHYVETCADLGVDVVPSLDRMLTIDYIMLNEDRHFGNFGLIRNADTLEWIGPAPIFDTGTSLQCGMDDFEMSVYHIPECKPFKKNFEEQLKLVSSFEWLDFDALRDAMSDVKEVIRNASGYLNEDRSELMSAILDHRIDMLEYRARGSITSRRGWAGCRRTGPS